MAAEIQVVVPGTRLPSPMELMAAVAEAGFDLATNLDDLPPRMDALETWSAPCGYRDGQVAFRIVVEKTPSGLAVMLRHRTKTERTVASILAATLARLVKRVVIVDADANETLRTARAAMAWAKRCDAECAGRREPRPRRASTTVGTQRTTERAKARPAMASRPS